MTTRKTVVRFSFVRTEVRVAYNSLAIGRSGTLIALGTNKTTLYRVEATLNNPASPYPSDSAMKLLWYRNASLSREVETRRGPEKEPSVRNDCRCKERRRRIPSAAKVRKTRPNRIADSIRISTIPPTTAPTRPNVIRETKVIGTVTPSMKMLTSDRVRMDWNPWRVALAKYASPLRIRNADESRTITASSGLE